MDKSGRRHTRLALRNLVSADATYDKTKDATDLTLTFGNSEKAIISLPNDESRYLGKVGEWLLNYRDRAKIGTS